MKNIIQAIISLILVAALLLAVTACTIDSVADAVNESGMVESEVIYADGSSKDAPLHSSTSNKKGDLQFSDNSDHYLSDAFLSEEEMIEFLIGIQTMDRQDAFSLATDCIAYDLYDAGHDVFPAFAVVGEEMVPGLAYTAYETYDETEEMTVYSCGFIQLTESGVDESVALTYENVERGVAIVPYGEYDTSVGFIVAMGAYLNSYSGIYGDYYFRYDQISDYTVSISVEENNRLLWDESIDLYNFTDDRFVFKGDMSYKGATASHYLSDEAKAYATAREAVEKIVELQNANSYIAEKQVIIIYTEDVVNEYILNHGKGTINGFLLEEIDSLNVESNQFVVVTTDGVSVETVVDTGALAKDRLTKGIIGFIGSALLVAGSIIVTVATCGAGAPLAVSAICVVAGASAAVYGVSNMIESGTDIYYGVNGDPFSEGFNPMLECFKAAISDDETAEKVYHIWGLTSSLIPTIIAPANAALSVSRAANASVWSTGLAITRAVAVETVKIAVTGIVAAGVGYGTDILVTEISGNESLGEILGFGSALLAGMFTYNGLNKLDARYNFSGLHSKQQIPTAKEKLKQFDSDENLQHHFEEHKEDFAGMFKNQDEYLEAANYVLNTGEYIPELNGYVKFIGVNGKANYAFVGLKNNGQNISTFHIKSVNQLSKYASFIEYLSSFGK